MNDTQQTKLMRYGPRLLNHGFDLLSVLPWVTLAGVYALAFWVRLSFGRWPVVYKDSPHLSWWVEQGLSCSMTAYLFGLLFLPVAWGLWLVLKIVLKQRQRLPHRAALFASGMITMYLLFRLDPQGFIEWFLD